MTMNRFQKLLWDLGEIIELPLYVDKNNVCKLLLNETLEVQLEIDTDEQKLLLIAFISAIPPGRFRENVLKEALKVNNLSHPFGAFAYIEQDNYLIFHQYLQTDNLSGKKLAENLESFVIEAEEWHSALANGLPAPLKYKNQEHTPPM